MDYELKITRRVPNPDYAPPKDAYGIMTQRYDIPQYSTYDVLSVEISPEQFEAIRKAVIDNF